MQIIAIPYVDRAVIRNGSKITVCEKIIEPENEKVGP